MRRSASEIIRDLEGRIAQLEKQAGVEKQAGMMTIIDRNPTVDPSLYHMDSDYNTQELLTKKMHLLKGAEITITEDGFVTISDPGRWHEIYEVKISKDDLIKELLKLAKPKSINMKRKFDFSKGKSTYTTRKH